MTQRVVNYTYGTGNPVLPDGSIDVRDGIDNLQSLDIFMNAPEDTYNQRDGEIVRTVAGMNNEFDAQILNMGFTRVGTFATGATLTNPRQTLLWDIADSGDGQEYGWSGVFPKVVPALSDPNSTGGIAVGAWISRFDPELKILVREALRRSYAEAGYTLVAGSFEAGGALVNSNDVLLHEASGKAYSGPAGDVAAGTDPTVVGSGYVPRADAVLRNALADDGGSELIGSDGGGTVRDVIDELRGGIDIRRITSDFSANNRTIIYSQSGRVFIPSGITVRCNLLPDDDVRKFVGAGSVITTDPWGYTHTVDVSAISSGTKLTARQMLSRANVALGTMAPVRIGCLGDSITDGAFGGAFTSPNPTDGSGNLSSTDYTHGATEATGSKSWFTLCINNMIGLIGHNANHPRAMFSQLNAASSGKGIASGWAYRNFDYGFFQNAAYGNAAPDVLFVSMGTNDIEAARSPALQDDYIDKCEALIAKAAGYGCKAVCFIAITHFRSLATAFYEATFKHITARHMTVDFINAAKYLEDYSNAAKGTYTGAWNKVPALGGGFDPVHPSVNGHKIIAGGIACELMPDRVTRVSRGDKFMAAQAGRTQAWTSSADELVPFGVSLSSPWLLPETGWPIYQASNTSTGIDMTLRNYVWCDEPMNLTIVEPKAADWPSDATKTTSVSLMKHGYDEAALTNGPLSSSGRDVASYCSTVVKDLVQGLNIVDINYDNVLNMYTPVLCFSAAEYDSKQLGSMAVNLTANTAMLYRHTSELSSVISDDRMPSFGADWLATVSVGKMKNGTAILSWFDVYAGTAYAVLKVSDTQANVCSVTSGVVMTVIQSVSGVFSGNFIVQFAQHTGTQGIVQITDSDLATTSVSIPVVRGGSIGVANTTGAPAKLIVDNIRVEIPKNNGTIFF